MKTALRSMLFAAVLFISSKQVNAQCAVSNIIIQNIRLSGTQTTGTCSVKFDASFTLENNNGNKFVFIHAWLQQSYPNYFHCVNGQPSANGAIHAPRGSDLANSFLNIGIENTSATPTVLTTYPPDGSVSMTSVDSISKLLNPDGSASFILKGIQVTVPVACGTPAVIVADLWSSQSANAQNAHCVNCGILNSAGYLSLQGLANCASLQYNATITNNTANPISGFYRVYVDVNSDGYFTPAIDTLIQDTTSFAVSGGPGTTTSISGPIPGANINQDLFILLTQTSGAASGASRVMKIASTQCATLPVNFQMFHASRTSRSNVLLNWETASEVNNSGFAVQRNMGNGVWEMVQWVPSTAVGGNSSTTIAYSLNDPNSFKGISQYRIKQVDLDGRTKFSEVRAVRGDGQNASTILYPNPTTDGRVTVVFEDIDGTRDLSLIDMSGRTVRQWKSVSGNTFQIDNLRQGVYTLRVQNSVTGDITVDKIVVTKN